VQVDQCLQDLLQEFDARSHRQIDSCMCQRFRLLQQLHREEWIAILVESVVEHADNVRVTQRGESMELLRQSQPQFLSHQRIGCTPKRGGFLDTPLERSRVRQRERSPSSPQCCCREYYRTDFSHRRAIADRSD